LGQLILCSLEKYGRVFDKQITVIEIIFFKRPQRKTFFNIFCAMTKNMAKFFKNTRKYVDHYFGKTNLGFNLGFN